MFCPFDNEEAHATVTPDQLKVAWVRGGNEENIGGGGCSLFAVGKLLPYSAQFSVSTSPCSSTL